MARRLLSYNKHKSVNPRPELYRQRIKARMEFHRKHMFYENQGILSFFIPHYVIYYFRKK